MKRTLLALLAGVGILVLMLNRVDLRQLGGVLRGVHAGFLLVSLGIKVLVMWIKSVRWAIVIQCATGRTVRRAFSASMIGFAGNVLLPGRLGELARVSVIDKHNQIGRSLALTSVGITQLFDLLFLVGYFLAASAWVTSLLTVYRTPMALLGGAVLLILASLVILQQRSQYFRALFFQQGASSLTTSARV